jgi:hypothetical protein
MAISRINCILDSLNIGTGVADREKYIIAVLFIITRTVTDS